MFQITVIDIKKKFNQSNTTPSVVTYEKSNSMSNRKFNRFYFTKKKTFYDIRMSTITNQTGKTLEQVAKDLLEYHNSIKSNYMHIS